MFKKMSLFLVLMLSLFVLAACSEYKETEQGIYEATVKGYDSDEPKYVELKLQNTEAHTNMNPSKTLYFDMGSSSEAKTLAKEQQVWILVTKYKQGSTIEYGVDALYKSQEDAENAIPQVEKELPSKILAKAAKGNAKYIVLSLEESNGKVTNAVPYKVSEEVFNTIKENEYYNLHVKISGPNIKILGLGDKIEQSVYDEYVKEQEELNKAQ